VKTADTTIWLHLMQHEATPPPQFFPSWFKVLAENYLANTFKISASDFTREYQKLLFAFG
jgi:hypothetical protein